MATQAQIKLFLGQLVVWFSNHFRIMFSYPPVYAMPLGGGGGG